MSMPGMYPGPDMSVNPDAGFQLAQGFNILVGRMSSLEQSIMRQTQLLERTVNAQIRYEMGGQNRVRQDVMSMVSSVGGPPKGYTGLTQMTGLGALTSGENLRTYAAQQIGQWVAGVPLYQPAGGGAQGPGTTPLGIPTAANVAAAGAGNAAGTAGINALAAQLAAILNQATGNAGVGGLPPWAAGAAVVGGGGGGGGGGGAPPAPPGGPPGGGPPGGPPGGPIPPGPGGYTGVPGWLANRYPNLNPQVLAGVQRFGARIAMSGGTGGGFGQALRDIPVVGLIADAISGTNNWIRTQREAGRVYQEIEGGSNWQAQLERLHEKIYAGSMYFSGMGPQAAAQAFGDVTALGYNPMAIGQDVQGQNRQSALNFIYGNYMQTGTSVDQSVQILQTASQNATISLGQVSSSLQDLSDIAGKSGANAQMARDQFNSYFQTALGQGAGPGAVGLAGMLSQLQASYGKQFAGANFGGELSPTQQYILGGQVGLAPSQFQFLMRTNPQAVGNIISGNNMQVIQQLLTPQEIQDIQQMIGAAGSVLTPDLVDQIANQFLNKWQPVDANLNLQTMAAVVNAETNVGVSPQYVMQWIVHQLAGQNEAQSARSQAAAQAKGAGQFTGSPAGTGPGTATGTGSRPLGRAGWLNPSSSGSSGTTTAVGNSFAQAHPSRNPVLNALAHNVNGADQVRVLTRNGPRVMSISDALKYYPNEIISGNVEFYDSKGQVLGDTAALTHGLIDPSVSTSSELAQTVGSNQGLPWAKWAKQHPGFGVKTGQTSGAGAPVMVDLTNEARQLLKLLPSNNDYAAAQGSYPYNPYGSTSSR